MSNSDIFRINATGESFYPNELALARGLLPDHLVEVKFGRVVIPTSNTSYDIWGGVADGFTEYPFLTEATTLEVASESANDTDGGTGIRTVAIFGLDCNYDLTSEVVTLSGQTAVETETEFIRIYRMAGISCGSLLKNAGNIWAASSDTTWDEGIPETDVYKQGIIEAGRGQTEMCIYTVPRGYSAYIATLETSISRGLNKTADVEAFVRTYSEGSYNNLGPWRNTIFLGMSATGTTFTRLATSLAMPSVPEKTDIRLTANADFTDDAIMARFSFILVKEPQG